MRGTRNALAEWPAPRYTRSRSRNSRTSRPEKTRFALEPVSAHRARGIHLEAAAEHGPLKTHGAALPDDGAKSSREHHELLIYDDVRLRPGTRGTCAPLFDEQVPPNPSNPARRKCSRWQTRGAATSDRTRPCPTSLVFTSPRLPPSSAVKTRLRVPSP